MEPFSHITADWAKQEASATDEKVEKQLNEILGGISLAVKHNEKSFVVSSLFENTRQELLKRGFKTYWTENRRKKKDDSFYTITW
jgi:hypothetical protein